MGSLVAKQFADSRRGHLSAHAGVRDPEPRRNLRATTERTAFSPAAGSVEPWDESASRLSSEARRQIDDLILPLRTVRPDSLDAEMGERLCRIVPMQQCLCVLVDHGCAGLDALPPRMHGTMPPELQQLYAAMIVERDPLLLRAGQEWRPLIGTVEEHCSWIRTKVRHAEVIKTWLTRNASEGAANLAVVPARGRLSRGALFAFFPAGPSDAGVFALFYAAQRLAIALELRYRPYIPDLLAMRFTARETDVLRSGLLGEPDDEIAERLGLTVDAIRYYFRKFRNHLPGEIGGIKPREFARVMHNLGKL